MRPLLTCEGEVTGPPTCAGARFVSVETLAGLSTSVGGLGWRTAGCGAGPSTRAGVPVGPACEDAGTGASTCAGVRFWSTGALAGLSTRAGATLGLGAGVVGDCCTRAGGLDVLVGAGCTRAGGAVNFVGGELGGDAGAVDAAGCGVGLAGGRAGDATCTGGAELVAVGDEPVGCGDAAGVGADHIGGQLAETIGLAAGASGVACASLPSSQRATTRLPTT